MYVRSPFYYERCFTAGTNVETLYSYTAYNCATKSCHSRKRRTNDVRAVMCWGGAGQPDTPLP
jgi:hypothetical protein